MFSKLHNNGDKVMSLKQIENQMMVNKMLHDGVVRDTQLSQAPSKTALRRIHAWSASHAYY